MKALCYTKPLGIGELEAALEMHEVGVPEPAKGQLLVRMHASSINIDDIHIAEGTFLGGMSKSKASLEQPSTPGVDVAGIVEKIGPGVTGFAGRVMRFWEFPIPDPSAGPGPSTAPCLRQ